jgi:hypothetical protein
MQKSTFFALCILLGSIFFYGCSRNGNSTSTDITKEQNDTNQTTDTNQTDNNNTSLLSVNFPTNYYPANAHPRLWLTQERLNDITQQKNDNTQKWQEFAQMCDDSIDNDSSNDPYGLDISPQNFTAPLALMYLLTQENKYADKALELMDSIDTNLSRYGDPDHQSWYFLALTYDWLYEYSGMTQARKTHYTNLMHELSNKFWTDFNINASGTDSDQNLLTGMMHLAFGAALYGDDTNAVELLDRGWYGWVKGYYLERGISNRDIIKSALGGVYFTGMAYFPSTDIIGIASYEMTLKSACEYDINTMEPDIKNFWSNTIHAFIALTEPNRAYISNYGSWQDPNLLKEQPWLRRMIILLEYFASEAGDDEAASLAKGYNEQVDIGYYNDYFLELFFTKNSIAAKDPYTQQLPLTQFFDNPDFMLFRDSWDSNASWGEFRGDGSIPLDQQSPDHGHFSLYKGDSYLTKAARNYEALSHGDFFNTLSIENGCTLNGVSCSGTAIFDANKSAQITRHLEHNNGTLFSYAMLNADGQWNDNSLVYDPVVNVQTYRRHFFWTPDYAIVYDRVRTKVPLEIRYRLRAMTEPTLNKDTVIQYSLNHKYKLMQKTLEPENITLHELNESEAWSNIDDWIIDPSERHYQSYIDFNQTDSVNILNVIQMGDATMQNFDTIEHINNNSSHGVRIGDWVVTFAADENLRTNVEYTIQQKDALHHLVCDMEEGSYKLSVNSNFKERLTVDAVSHSAYFELNSTNKATSISLIKE